MSLSAKEILRLGEKQLKECGVEDATLDSKLLYCYVMKIPKSRLILEYQRVLSDTLCDEYFRLLDRRSEGEPLQYIVGTQEFMGLTFRVNSAVLIPRQDTEVLVENALSLITEGRLDGSSVEDDHRQPKDVLDLCTGSGAIGLSLMKLCKGLKVTCSDLSKDALAVAMENANLLNVKVDFTNGDLFQPFFGRLKKKRFDMIVSNPPYVRTETVGRLQREIREHEPIMALDGGADGLDIYKRIISEAPMYLRKHGVLMMEIGWDQKEDIFNLMNEDGNYAGLKCIKDLSGRDRVIYAYLK